MNLPQYQIGTMNPEHLKTVAEKYGIFYTIHLDENLNPCDFNPAVAKAYRDTAVEAIQLARELRIPVLNMHMPVGVYFTLPERKVYLFQQYREEYLSALRKFREACTAAVGDSGIKLCVENWHGYTDWQLEGLDVLLESPAFCLTFDVGHNHCKGGQDEPAIMGRVRRLRHIHLHDATDGQKDHLPLGTGELDIQSYIELAKKQCATVVLETKTTRGLRESVHWLRDHRKQ